ncbi:conserved Plasmodium protein, unknown function [Plasmodium ovale]|uniref:Uncharacterized protein n=1 Tax=Plasmodium ovale TaxID=36330 RepID=A0A1D3TKP3_PLAOA|nr:conserved Plasmodium protein, unknown function [Plasmodium ovale]
MDELDNFLTYDVIREYLVKSSSYGLSVGKYHEMLKCREGKKDYNIGRREYSFFDMNILTLYDELLDVFRYNNFFIKTCNFTFYKISKNTYQGRVHIFFFKSKIDIKNIFKEKKKREIKDINSCLKNKNNIVEKYKEREKGKEKEERKQRNIVHNCKVEGNKVSNIKDVLKDTFDSLIFFMIDKYNIKLRINHSYRVKEICNYTITNEEVYKCLRNDNYYRIDLNKLQFDIKDYSFVFHKKITRFVDFFKHMKDIHSCAYLISLLIRIIADKNKIQKYSSQLFFCKRNDECICNLYISFVKQNQDTFQKIFFNSKLVSMENIIPSKISLIEEVKKKIMSRHDLIYPDELVICSFVKSFYTYKLINQKNGSCKNKITSSCIKNRLHPAKLRNRYPSVEMQLQKSANNKGGVSHTGTLNGRSGHRRRSSSYEGSGSHRSSSSSETNDVNVILEDNILESKIKKGGQNRTDKIVLPHYDNLKKKNILRCTTRLSAKNCTMESNSAVQMQSKKSSSKFETKYSEKITNDGNKNCTSEDVMYIQEINVHGRKKSLDSKNNPHFKVNKERKCIQCNDKTIPLVNYCRANELNINNVIKNYENEKCSIIDRDKETSNSKLYVHKKEKQILQNFYGEKEKYILGNKKHAVIEVEPDISSEQTDKYDERGRGYMTKVVLTGGRTHPVEVDPDEETAATTQTEIFTGRNKNGDKPKNIQIDSISTPMMNRSDVVKRRRTYSEQCGGKCEDNYNGHCEGLYERNYNGNYEGNYDGHYERHCERHSERHSERHCERHCKRHCEVCYKSVSTDDIYKGTRSMGGATNGHEEVRKRVSGRRGTQNETPVLDKVREAHPKEGVSSGAKGGNGGILVRVPNEEKTMNMHNGRKRCDFSFDVDMDVENSEKGINAGERKGKYVNIYMHSRSNVEGTHSKSIEYTQNEHVQNGQNQSEQNQSVHIQSIHNPSAYIQGGRIAPFSRATSESFTKDASNFCAGNQEFCNDLCIEIEGAFQKGTRTNRCLQGNKQGLVEKREVMGTLNTQKNSTNGDSIQIKGGSVGDAAVGEALLRSGLKRGRTEDYPDEHKKKKRGLVNDGEGSNSGRNGNSNGDGGDGDEVMDRGDRSNGSNGLDDSIGRDGSHGRNGREGSNGREGINGCEDINGCEGSNGHNAISGRDGINDRDGVSGRDGVNGRDGSNVGSISVSVSGVQVDDDYLMNPQKEKLPVKSEFYSEEERQEFYNINIIKKINENFCYLNNNDKLNVIKILCNYRTYLRKILHYEYMKQDYSFEVETCIFYLDYINYNNDNESEKNENNHINTMIDDDVDDGDNDMIYQNGSKCITKNNEKEKEKEKENVYNNCHYMENSKRRKLIDKITYYTEKIRALHQIITSYTQINLSNLDKIKSYIQLTTCIQNYPCSFYYNELVSENEGENDNIGTDTYEEEIHGEAEEECDHENEQDGNELQKERGMETLRGELHTNDTRDKRGNNTQCLWEGELNNGYRTFGKKKEERELTRELNNNVDSEKNCKSILKRSFKNYFTDANTNDKRGEFNKGKWVIDSAKDFKVQNGYCDQLIPDLTGRTVPYTSVNKRITLDTECVTGSRLNPPKAQGEKAIYKGNPNFVHF